MSTLVTVPADVVWTFFGLRFQTWLIILGVLIVVLITRAILRSMKKAEIACAEEKLKEESPSSEEAPETQPEQAADDPKDKEE